MSELTVILKDSERTYRHKSLIYESYTIGDDTLHKVLADAIEEAKKNFQGEPDEIQIKIHLEVS